MTDAKKQETAKSGSKDRAEDKKQRQAAALRANLRRRKEQSRQRSKSDNC